MNTMLDYDLIHKPQLFNSTKLGRDQINAGIQPSMNRSISSKNAAFKSMSLTAAGETVCKNTNPTAHWSSTYRNVNEVVDASEKIKSRRPLWSINRQAYSSSRGRYMTEFGEAFGKHGHNPRDILPNDATKQANKINDLSVGSTKVTMHIPGYNGFIPQIDVNEKAVNQSKGQNARNTIVKQNIVENYCVKLPGYQGHQPMSVVNDRGSIRPTCLSTKGEAFN